MSTSERRAGLSCPERDRLLIATNAAAITVLACLALVLVTAEIALRLFVEGGDITPGVLREKSVQYQDTIFSRHVFKQSTGG